MPPCRREAAWPDTRAALAALVQTAIARAGSSQQRLRATDASRSRSKKCPPLWDRAIGRRPVGSRCEAGTPAKVVRLSRPSGRSLFVFGAPPHDDAQRRRRIDAERMPVGDMKVGAGQADIGEFGVRHLAEAIEFASVFERLEKVEDDLHETHHRVRTRRETRGRRRCDQAWSWQSPSQEFGTAEPARERRREDAALPARSLCLLRSDRDIATPILINPTNVSNL